MDEANSADLQVASRADGLSLPHGLPHRLWLDGVVVFLAGWGLYVATCAPDVLMGDSGLYQLAVHVFPAFSELTDTLVRVHPLYLVLAKVFTWLPVGSVAYRVNLASPLFGAMTLASVFLAVRLLTGSRWAAAIGTLSVGLGHTFWAHSVVAECLSLASACMTTELLALLMFARTGRTRWFLAVALINGLSISNHMLGALATPIYAVLALVWVRRGRLSRANVLAAFGLWVLGTGLYLFIILEALVQSGDLAQVVRSATTGRWPVLNVAITVSMLAKVVAYIGLQYPTLLVLLAVPAMWVRPSHEALRPVKWAIVGVAALQFVFAARYPAPDQYSFFVPCYACLGSLIGLGAWAAIRRWRWTRWAGVALAIVPIGVYIVLPGAARRAGLNPFTRSLPYRDPYAFFLKPWQNGYYGVRRYIDEVCKTLPRDAILFADSTPAPALLYAQQVEARRPDLKIIWAWKQRPLEKLLVRDPALRWVRPVYTVSADTTYAPPAFIRDCRLVREGVVYRVDPPSLFPKTPWK